jgi:crotonobetainyl-CoA:carnitine CoA-transferase CaiB-like acyl-CoA transferase
MLLADFGADVIKVESLEGDPFRAFGLGFLGWNRGKRGISVDLRTDEGRDIVYHLVREADVLVENFRIGTSHRLRVDYDTIREINPRIVYCTVAGWGETGPYSHLPVFDPVFQASSGAISAQGGDGDPVFLAPAITDYGASTARPMPSLPPSTPGSVPAKAAGVVTLTAPRWRCSPANSSFRPKAAVRPRPQRRRDFVGPSAAYRSYRCSDGFIFIACSTEAHWHAFAKSIGRPGSLRAPGRRRADRPEGRHRPRRWRDAGRRYRR